MRATLPEPGDTIGPYRVVGELARGGQGAVFEVERAGQRLALKLLLDPDPTSQARFAQEARVLHGLRHPQLPRVFDLGQDADRHYLVMDFVQGPSLSAHVRQRGVPQVPWSARTVQVLAETLHYCHAQGIVHRDVKPANAILTQAGPVLVDFGLLRRDSRSLTALTEAGEVLGTPAYMAPEQAEGALGEIGPSADVYALGATLYFLLTGQPPFRGPNIINVLHAVLLEPAPDPRAENPAVPPELAALCQRAMAKDPAERPRSAADLARALSPWAGPSAAPTDAPPARAFPALAAAVALAALGLLAAGWNLLRSPAPPPPAARPRDGAAASVAPPPLASPSSPRAAPTPTPNKRLARADLRRGQGLENENDWDGAIRCYRQALARDPDLVEANLVLANALTNRGEFQAAHESLDAIESPGRLLSGCAFVRAALLSAEGRRDEALEQLEVARATSSALVTEVLLIDVLARLGRLDEAQDVLDEALRAAPGPHPAIDAKRALLAYLRGDTAQAQGLLAALRADAAAFPDIRLVRAEVLLGSEQPQKALEDCDLYLARFPFRPLAHALRAIALASLRDVRGAKAAAQRAVELAPRAPEAWYALANVALHEQDYARAIALCGRVFELHPHHPRALNLRAYASGFTQDFRAAEADLTWLIEHQRRAFPVLHYQRAMARVGQRRFVAALDDLSRCLELTPDLHDARWVRFQARAWTGDLPGAIADGRHLVELGFAHPNLHTHLGLLLLLQGETASGKEAFRLGASGATEAYPLLWDTLHGGDDLALRQLAERTSSAWDAALAQLVLGERDAASLMAQAERLEPDERAVARCQVRCYQGLLAERRRDPASARGHYRDAAAETAAVMHYEHLWASRRLEQLADE